MDTGTHFVMGVGLFGLAHLDPVVVTHPETAHAVLLATVIGSQIPDSDGLYRLGGNAAYIRNHRGWSHSLPMQVIWPTILSIVLSFFFPKVNFLHLWLWSFIAVFFHIFIDCFNTYGTRAFSPIIQRWISWNVLNIFDPFIFTLHVIGFLLWWVIPVSPGIIFSFIYLILISYVGWRTWVHYQVVEWVKQELNMFGRYTVTPTVRWNVWNMIVEQPELVKVGEIRRSQLFWTGQISKDNFKHPAVIHSKQADPIDAFLSFTSYGYPQVFNRSYGYEVRWLDVRYHYKKHFPFVAVALLDHQYQFLNSYVGWLSEEQLEKKVQDLLLYSLKK